MSIEKIASVIESKAGMLTKASDNIWEYAEMAFREHKSMEELCGILEAEGFEVKKGIGDVETAFSGSFGSGKPVIGILGEFDALDNLNQVAGCTHKESFIEGAPGHGCGHNLFGVGSLAAAIAVKEYLQETGASGIPTIIGALLGYLLGELSAMGLALSLGFASGAMLYVVFGEILPQAILMYTSKLPAFSAIFGMLVGMLIIFA